MYLPFMRIPLILPPKPPNSPRATRVSTRKLEFFVVKVKVVSFEVVETVECRVAVMECADIYCFGLRSEGEA